MSATPPRYAAQKDCIDPIGPGLAPWSVWDTRTNSPIAHNLNKSAAHGLAAQLNAGITGFETPAGFRRAICPFCGDENALQDIGPICCGQCNGEFNVTGFRPVFQR